MNATNTAPLQLEGEVLEEVDAFSYLGSAVDKQGGTDVNVRASKNRQSKGSVCIAKEHLELEGNVLEVQDQTVQHQCQVILAV